MFLYSAVPETVYTPEIHMISWMMADHNHIYTINGYSGNYPKGWVMAYQNREAYLTAVEKWFLQKKITDTSTVYAYIPEEDRWISYEEVRKMARKIEN